MKQSLLKLFSSAYIILISVVLIVISAYAWMVISDSPMVGGAGFNLGGRDSLDLPEKNYSIWDGTPADIESIEQSESGTYIIRTASEFAAVMELISQAPQDAQSGDVAMMFEADISMADLPWTPVTVHPERASSRITILGNDKEIACLTAPLFANGAVGEDSEIIIHNLTVNHSDIRSTNDNGSGAFIECASGVGNVSLANCQLINSSVSGKYTGGLVGYTAGRSADGTDPAITSDITIENCHVDNCSIVGVYTVGGIVGRAGAVAETNTVIENCTVTNTSLTATSQAENLGIGTMLGIANYGQAYVIECEHSEISESGLSDETLGLVYGSEDYGTTGRLVIIKNGNTTIRENQTGVFNVATADDLEAALAKAADPTYEGDVTINIMNDIDMSSKDWTPLLLATENSTAVITVNGNGNAISGLSAPLFAGGVRAQQGQETLVIQNLTIRDSNMVSTNTWGNGALIECVAGLQNVTITNCHLIDSTLTSNTVDADGNEKGSRTGGLIGWTATGTDADGNAVDTTVTVSDCSVQGSNIEGYGTVGGIIGHAGYNASVSHTITGCHVENTTLTSTESPYKGVGTVVGTANIGEVYIEDCTSSNVTENVVSGDEGDNIVGLAHGRVKIGSTGKLVINDGGDIFEFVDGALNATISSSEGFMKVMDYSEGFDGPVNISMGDNVELMPF